MPPYKGPAKRLDDYDAGTVGKDLLGIGEDLIRAVLEVETRGTGFDKLGRVIMLFEPHVFHRLLPPSKRPRAIGEGLAYPKWGTRPYPRDSYPAFERAMAIDELAAYGAASWGLGQIMGFNHAKAGYPSAQAMVSAFAADEEEQLRAMAQFVKGSHLDDDLRRLQRKIDAGQTVTAADWIPFVEGYNGEGYARNDYHNRAAKALAKWRRVKDATAPFSGSVNLKAVAAAEEMNAAMDPDDKGVTTSAQGTAPADASGTPAPAEAVNVVASRPTLKSVGASVLMFVLAPLSYLGIDVKELAGPGAEFARTNFMVAVKLVVAFAFVVLAVFLFKWAMDRANQRTLKLVDMAGDKNKNNVRLVDPPKGGVQPYQTGDWMQKDSEPVRHVASVSVEGEMTYVQ